MKNEGFRFSIFFHFFTKIPLSFPSQYITICNMMINTYLKGSEVITTARLPMDTRSKLLVLSRVKNKTKSEIIIESLELYYRQEEGEIDSFSLGEAFFGKYASGESDRSTTYKQRIKKKLSGRVAGC